MTSAPHLSATPSAGERPLQQSRLRLRPEAPVSGYVDGAWWPRSRDLAAELPALLAAPAVRLDGITRVSYGLAEWEAAPRRLVADGVRVRLNGFWTRPAHTLDLIAGDRRRLTLLVVPSDTDPFAAHHMMTSAARQDNADTVEDLFRAGVKRSEESTVDAWDTEGGRLPQQKTREA
ncbi:DUF5994 family protein [Lentzea sp. JNUCC 0626]|uniref:DUF5994 family protein n=1 Tax=Lentzea sp. JNUCC 0626 TaxID=3367513 RepID=UPI003748C2E3